MRINALSYACLMSNSAAVFLILKIDCETVPKDGSTFFDS